MANRRKESAIGLPQAISTVITGGLLAFGVCVVCMAGAAGLISVGKLGEQSMFQVCCFGCALGCLIGGFYAAKTCGSRLLPVALTASALSFLLWVAAGVALYGSVSLRTGGAYLIASLTGGAVAGVCSAGGKRRRN